MRCPSCGAVHSSEQCPEPATTAVKRSPTSDPVLQSDDIKKDNLINDDKLDASLGVEDTKPTSRLIEFPGVTRSSVPQWRKELSQRVREVQDRRAHEAALEKEEAEKRRKEQASMSPPPLELLPQAEAPPMNPIVAAALRRIERAHQEPNPGETATMSRSHSTALSQVANREAETKKKRATGNSNPARARGHFATNKPNTNTNPPPAVNSAAAVAPAVEKDILPISEPAPTLDRQLNLVPVQSPAVAQIESSSDNLTLKPKRLIVDNDPALSYLDSVTTSAMPVNLEGPAPVFSRLAAEVIDLLVTAFLCLPFAAVVELQNGNWLDPRIAGLMIGIAVVVMFVYVTITTALTGRTLGMRIASLRIVDCRTRLIPTGKQSAGRALVYILSFATLGIGFCYALVNSERKTAHDRLSRTAVVRV